MIQKSDKAGAPFIIIGAGQAAAQAVASLRSEGFGGEIHLFGDEPHLPYQRPPLSKTYLAGEIGTEKLELRPRAFYDDHHVALHLSTRIAAIDPAAHMVETSEGQSFPYARLLIATGTRPRPLNMPGDGMAGIHFIRAISDVEHFRAAFKPGARLVVIGGGYIGLEVAAKARAKGLDVTVLESQSRILARALAPQTAAYLAELHQENGVRILTDVAVAALEGSDHIEAVRLSDGTRLPADILLIAIGAMPNAELAVAAGIATSNGITVDTQTRTSAPDIFAAGDVACFPSRLFGRPLRIESVPNAIDMAKAAATAMLGMPVTYDPVPWFWSDQYAIKLQIAGLSQGYDRVECEGSYAEGRLAVRYFAGDRLLAVDTINDARTHMLARRALADIARA